MSRGIMFNITTDPDALGNMSEEDFYDCIDLLHVDYVQDQDAEQAAKSTDRLMAEMLKARFPVIYNQNIDEGIRDRAAFAFCFKDQSALDAARQAWFRDDLNILKDKIQSMSLQDFSSDDGVIYCLKELIDNNNGDAVYLNMGTGPAIDTISRFVRNLIPGVMYYVSKQTIYMH